MIYLIDDNKTRQKDFGWTEERFAQYDNILVPLYTIDDVIYIGDKLYNDDNIILYHESFLDFTANKEKAVEQRNKLIEKAASNTSLSVAFFSGSQSSRTLVENTAFLPVAILYQNIKVLIQQHSQNNGNLKYLLFGEKPEIEKELDEIIATANTNIDKDAAIIEGKNLFIRPNLRYIQNAIEGAKEVTIFSEVSDEKLSQKINEWLNQEEYDNIFIPLCFGQTLSDFNGLRLATHIRCTETPNQLKRIFIYSFIGIEYLLHNEFFNILKTKNVNLVDYSKKAFQTAATHKLSSLKPYELIKEMKMLELQPPRNYIDNHSIANEWAIYQWAKIIGCDEKKELLKVFQNVETNLYFKYLRTIHPITEVDVILTETLKFKCKGKRNTKVLLIDDEADKGWYGIFEYLLYYLNDIDIDYLGSDFKNLSEDSIIDKSIDKIFTDDIDIVILDFRLNTSDFENKSLEQITSVKLLKKLKESNPGIQVIAFSATNKIWNLQVLQEARADGFIFKNSSHHVDQTIKSLISKIKLCEEKAFLLKPMYNSFQTLKQRTLKLSDTFKNNIDNNLSVCFELLEKSFQIPKYRNFAYLQLYHIVEEFIKEDSVFEYGSNCYVINSTSRYLVLSKIDATKNDSPAYSAIKFTKSNGHYHIEHSKYYRTVDTNFIMSAILLFRHGFTTSGGANWSRIYSIRNKKAAHPEMGIVEYSEINLLVKFLAFIVDESNLKFVEPNNALKELSLEEQVNNLKKSWGAK